MSTKQKYLELKIGDSCPNCNLGKGLRASSPIEFGLTGWEDYHFLHCPVCGITYVGHKGAFTRFNVEPLRID